MEEEISCLLCEWKVLVLLYFVGMVISVFVMRKCNFGYLDSTPHWITLSILWPFAWILEGYLFICEKASDFVRYAAKKIKANFKQFL